MSEMIMVRIKKNFKILQSIFLQMWDPDFTKTTVGERLLMDKIDKELEKGIFYTEEDVWS